MAKIYVYSTLSNDQNYITWAETPEGSLVGVKEHEVLIKGGANIATKHFDTPAGVRTEITDFDLDHLKRNMCFQKHVDGGFIQVREEKVDAEVAVGAGMNQKDESAPVTPNDFESRKEFKNLKADEKPKIKQKDKE